MRRPGRHDTLRPASGEIRSAVAGLVSITPLWRTTSFKPDYAAWNRPGLTPNLGQLDPQALEWGSVVQRRASREPVDRGGWNIFYTWLGGFGNISPAPNIAIRGNGTAAWFGWPTNARLEELHAAWFDASDPAAQQKICEAMQVAFWQDPTYAPLGMYDQPTAFRNDLRDVPAGWPQFYGLKKLV